ncbi:MAG: hypothetical protein OXM61_13535 [Candidatus Poribacteria bacterium]|nr:hypothetical protein [Candidatus Poribacteria bacterium]
MIMQYIGIIGSGDNFNTKKNEESSPSTDDKHISNPIKDYSPLAIAQGKRVISDSIGGF